MSLRYAHHHMDPSVCSVRRPDVTRVQARCNMYFTSMSRWSNKGKHPRAPSPSGIRSGRGREGHGLILWTRGRSPKSGTHIRYAHSGLAHMRGVAAGTLISLAIAQRHGPARELQACGSRFKGGRFVI